MKKKEPIEVVPIKEEKELFSWQAYSRPFQKRDRDFWVTALATFGLVAVLLFLVGEWGLIAALFALLFLYYVLTTVEPEKVSHRLTTKGIYFLGLKQKIDWDFLRTFYFSERWGHTLLRIETFSPSLPQLTLIINVADKERIREICKRYLPEGEEEKTLPEKISRWIYSHLPFEIEELRKRD